MGRPKALLEVDGTTILERTVSVALQCVDSCVLVGEPDFDVRKALAPLRVIPDAVAQIGPMGGLSSLLTACPNSCVVLLACDMPRLTAVLLRSLLDATGAWDVAVPETVNAGRVCVHACCAAYRPTARPFVEKAIRDGRYAMSALIVDMEASRMRLKGAAAAQVENWNRPSDIVG